MKRLGIDLGTSSLGWAVIDDERMENTSYGYGSSPIDCGVVIFEEGMKRDKSSNLKSRAAERRRLRAARRLIRRRKYRKFQILKVLSDNGMCPIAENSLKKWKEKGCYPVNDEEFMAWLAATNNKNPYADRKHAAEGPVDKYTFGRAMYHIAQRRGFKSSKKEQKMALGADSEDDSKSKKTQDTEITQTKGEIDKLTKMMGEKTLGQFFYDLFKSGEKIRGRKTGRKEHYEKEFEQICSMQDNWLTDELKERLHDIIFFQRPLRIQRHLVGWCELESANGTHKYRRCLESHPSYQRFALLCLLNNLKIKHEGDTEFRNLSKEERDEMIGYSFRKSPLTIEDLMEKFNKKNQKNGNALWVCNHRSDLNVQTLKTEKCFSDLGISRERYQMALNALVDFQDMEMLEKWARNKLGLNNENARKFITINPSTERARYSLHAISLILPWLEQGFQLSKAIFLAKIPELIPDFEKNGGLLLEKLHEDEVKYREDKRSYESDKSFPQAEPLKMRWKKTFMDFCFNTVHWEKAKAEEAYSELYVDNTETNTVEKDLPPVDMGSIRNPMVLRSLTVLRKLVNTLRKNGIIDTDTQINIELARTVNSANMCCAIEKYQIARKKENEKYIEELKKHLKDNSRNDKITEDILLRYRLWEEQDHFSVYTGQPIGFDAMLDSCDIEHTIPRSRGGTNKLENLTLCESNYNRDIKKNLLPTECPNYTCEWTDPKSGITYPSIMGGKVMRKWQSDNEKIKTRKPRRGNDPDAYSKSMVNYLAEGLKRKYLKEKLSTFSLTAESASQTSFMPRQLVDTGSISKFAVKFLKQRYPHVYARNGSATAFARKSWGLQAKDEEKDRSDHVHHAVDAIVIAALDTKRFSEICRELEINRSHNFNTTVNPPYNNFGEITHQAVESILVRNLTGNKITKPVIPIDKRCGIRLATPAKTNNGVKLHSVDSSGSTVRGSLHNDNLYGKILHRENGEDVERVVLRKTIAKARNYNEFEKWINNAVDKSVHETLKKQVANYLSNNVDKKEIKQKKFWGPKDKNGTPDEGGIPLKKIRIFCDNVKHPFIIRRQQFKSGGSSCHENVYGTHSDLIRLEVSREVGSGNKKTKFRYNVVSLIDAVRDGEINNTDVQNKVILWPGIVAIAYKESPSELRKMSLNELSKRMYVLEKFEPDGKSCRGKFVFHREARTSTELSDWLKREGKNKDGSSKIDFEVPERRLRISDPASKMAFEGVDFTLDLTGQIHWPKQND